VTLVRDATAAFSAEAMHAAHELNGPTFAHAIVTTAELLGESTSIAVGAGKPMVVGENSSM
jgi:nicotinamidase-related amidase